MTAAQRGTAGTSAIRPQPGDYVLGRGAVIADPARPAGWDTAPAPLRTAFDVAWQRSGTAHRAYRDAFTASGGRGVKVRRLEGQYTDAYASMSAARDALTDPVHIAVETLQSIGAQGLPGSRREDALMIAMRARCALGVVPVPAAPGPGGEKQ